MSKEEFKQKAAAQDDKHVTMIYSAESDAMAGHVIAQVPDGKGGKKEVRYTILANPDQIKFKDKQIIWEGKQSEIEVTGHSAKAEQGFLKSPASFYSETSSLYYPGVMPPEPLIMPPSYSPRYSTRSNEFAKKARLKKEIEPKAEAQGDRHITMVYSAESDAMAGHHIARVPDGNGGKKEVRYTIIANPDRIKFADKQIVWEGKESEQEHIGRSPLAEQRFQESLHAFRDQPPSFRFR